MTTASKRKSATKAELQEAVDLLIEDRKTWMQEAESLVERIVELEDRDWEWQRISSDADFEFSRQGLADIIKQSRLMFLKNPLIQRAVTVQGFYVFGQGWDIDAQDEAINDYIQRFLDDPSNQTELTSQKAATDKEEELTVTGNLFLILFSDRQTGRVVVRSIPVEEIEDIICNPEDSQDVWYFKRVWHKRVLNPRTGVTTDEQATEFYPHWRYEPKGSERLMKIGTHDVRWDAPVYHIKVGGFHKMKFGVPEIYAALDWAKAVKADLEDYASLRRSLSRFAWKLTTGGGARGINALKTQFNTTLHDGSGQGETNPPPTVGSMAIFGDSTKLEPVRTAGAAPHPDEGRRMWLMVSAATGIPETILAGDADVGNLATAKSLDRPTELKMRSRQELWKQVFEDVIGYAIERAVEAPGGALKGIGTVIRDDVTGRKSLALGGDRSAHVDIEFPSILDRNVLERVEAVIKAATLDGKVPANTMTHETLVKLLLVALGTDDPDEEIARLEQETPVESTMTAESRFAGALEDFRLAVREAVAS